MGEFAELYDHVEWEDEESYLCCICEKHYVAKDYPICYYCDDEGNEYEEEDTES